MAMKKKAKAAAKKARKAVKKVVSKVKATAKRARGRRSDRRTFMDTYAREQATTLRVLRAFPAGTSDFRPHERSQSVAELTYTLLFEQELKRRALMGGPIMGGGVPPAKPANFEAAILQFERGYQAMVELLQKTQDAAMEKTVQFPKGPGQMGDWPTRDFLWMMLHDHIHHRGQLTVMLRMAGGKVPSIYGPSGDEPWT